MLKSQKTIAGLGGSACSAGQSPTSGKSELEVWELALCVACCGRAGQGALSDLFVQSNNDVDRGKAG